MTELSDAVAKAMAEANEIFKKMGAAVDQGAKGAADLNVVDIARRAGLEIDEGVLRELQIDLTIHVHPFIPWYVWWPWRPLWCWWWHRHYPWYRCCPWWWYRCHWWSYPC